MGLDILDALALGVVGAALALALVFVVALRRAERVYQRELRRRRHELDRISAEIRRDVAHRRAMREGA